MEGWVRPRSMIKEDDEALIASFGPSAKDETHDFYVRGVKVDRFKVTARNDAGQVHRVCRFPDGRDMWVNEGNIVARRKPHGQTKLPEVTADAG